MKTDIIQLNNFIFLTLLFFFLPYTFSSATGQEYMQRQTADDTTRTDNRQPGSFCISAGLITTGIFLNAAGNGSVKENFQRYVQSHYSGFQTNLDDYMQWFPAAEIGIAGLAGIKPAHSLLHQAGLYSISVTANAIIVAGVKELTGITRPNGGDHSFPSGHTSNAFVNATVLYLEYRDENKMLAWSGYLFATTTGILRILNNAHWISDVVAGAGVGILIPHIIYALDPFSGKLSRENKRNSTSLILTPVAVPGNISFHLSYIF